MGLEELGQSFGESSLVVGVGRGGGNGVIPVCVAPFACGEGALCWERRSLGGAAG